MKNQIFSNATPDFLYINTSSAQQLRLSIIGAVSKETGFHSEQFNWGFSAGGNIFLSKQ